MAYLHLRKLNLKVMLMDKRTSKLIMKYYRDSVNNGAFDQWMRIRKIQAPPKRSSERARLVTAFYVDSLIAFMSIVGGRHDK